ncbi:hypothetical protein [Ornithinimicrobium pekingense]|uniref:DUF4157 domain-containing protein n=1 Tax=Ornithinimicrobium pekingense TaxID=384677 RepID=A0ABQ2F4Y6_9MICO|nr:hypothetical protein [Ornithinimicrobium pekingense]GGK61450.1 hypothetical protein GCM10011509_07350 [Ornithinimicrobium pekingense]
MGRARPPLRASGPPATHPSLLPDALPLTRAVTLRNVLNWVNLSTPLGLALAGAGGCRLRRGPERCFLADRYRWRFPAAGAFTVGDVVLSRHDLDLLAARRPTLVRHELVHSRQWAYCWGLPFLPLYVASMGWSWLRTGDRAARSVFEREAGLHDGGYADVPPRPLGVALREAGARLSLAVRGRRGLDAGADVGTGRPR